MRSPGGDSDLAPESEMFVFFFVFLRFFGSLAVWGGDSDLAPASEMFVFFVFFVLWLFGVVTAIWLQSLKCLVFLVFFVFLVLWLFGSAQKNMCLLSKTYVLLRKKHSFA